MTDIFVTVLNMSTTASYLVLAIIVLRAVLKNAPKWVRGILWSLAGIRLICPFSFQSVLSLIPSSKPISADADNSSIHLETGISTVNSALSGLRFNQTAAPKPGISFDGILPVLTWIWLAGVLAMLIYSLVTYLRIKRRVRASVKTGKNVWLCDGITTPFILGLFAPRIYLPSSINESDAEFVLSHEKAHLKRGDHLWKPLGFLLLTVYWFNPLLWVGYALLCRDIELACDERVIKDMEPGGKRGYSEALLSCSIRTRNIAACPLAFGEVGVKQRIKSVLSYKKPAVWVIAAALVACAVTAVCLATNPKDKITVQPGKYSATEIAYENGMFDYSMPPEAVGIIEISFDTDRYMNMCSFDGEVLVSGSQYTKIKLTADNFDSLISYADIWYDNESIEKMRKENSHAWRLSASSEINYQLPYMLLQQKDSTVYAVYAEKPTENVYISRIFILKPVNNFDNISATESEYIIYTCNNSVVQDIQPSIWLCESEKSFSFTWSALSSYIAHGKYNLTENILTLVADDGNSSFVFTVNDNGNLIFDAKNSTEIPEYTYTPHAKPLSPVQDGAVFSESGKTNVDPIASSVMDSILADIDSDGKNELCSLSFGPTSGLFTFVFSATENGEQKYKNTFTCDWLRLSFVRNNKGAVQLQGVTQENVTYTFDISVADGSIVLTEQNGVTVPYWGE